MSTSSSKFQSINSTKHSIMANIFSIIIALWTMTVLVIASTSTSTTCDTSQLQKSIDALTDKIDMLVNLTLTVVDPIPPKPIIPKDNCSCNSNAKAIENNTQDIEELYSKNEELEDQIEQFKLTINLLVEAFDNFTKTPDICNGTVFPSLKSCQEIKDKCPRSRSGYYTLASGKCYCHMGDLCSTSGGWTRIAYLNMSDAYEQCPPGFKVYNQNGVRGCGRAALRQRYCESHKFSSKIEYSQVCGKLIGYQYWSPNGLSTGTSDINSYYVDGVSLTYGSPRKHIWTFITAMSENGNNCPCATGSTVTVPSFIGKDYFCESGSPSTPTRKLYSDALWDGKNCRAFENPCCQASGIPWFHKTLETSTNDDIELRICNDHDDEDTPVGFYDIYVK